MAYGKNKSKTQSINMNLDPLVHDYMVVGHRESFRSAIEGTLLSDYVKRKGEDTLVGDEEFEHAMQLGYGYISRRSRSLRGLTTFDIDGVYFKDSGISFSGNGDIRDWVNAEERIAGCAYRYFSLVMWVYYRNRIGIHEMAKKIEHFYLHPSKDKSYAINLSKGLILAIEALNS